MHLPEPLLSPERIAMSLMIEAASDNPSSVHLEKVRAALANAWEEGRRSPPGACLNPYGETTLPELQQARARPLSLWSRIAPNRFIRFEVSDEAQHHVAEVVMAQGYYRVSVATRTGTWVGEAKSMQSGQDVADKKLRELGWELE